MTGFSGCPTGFAVAGFSAVGGRWSAVVTAVLLALVIAPPASAQYPWPFPPFNTSREITGSFAEYRDTGSAPHFHNGADIPQPDGSPVYAVADGRVTDMGADWIRVENFAYVHVVPSPRLAFGDSVRASETIVGTILTGNGHVHLTDGYPGQERQPLRPETGLTPFSDSWPPVIENVRFFHQPTRLSLAPGDLTGDVEITFKVKDRHAPAGAAESRLNNGAYTVGYKVLSRDRQQELVVPGTDGVQFRFDVKPSDSYVHNVYDRTQSSTSDHVYIVTNRVTGPAAWNTALLPEGDYTVMVFAGDTRGNEAIAYVDVRVQQRDILPPPDPELLAVTADGSDRSFLWTGSEVPDFAGYLLYRSSSPGGPWARWPGEEPLPDSAIIIAGEQTDPAAWYYYVTAVDTMSPPNESRHGDVYGAAPDPEGRRLLIVDGFDRKTGSGSWLNPWHAFAAHHGRAIASAGFGFNTAANEALTGGSVTLADYDAVFWVLGDESTQDETFSGAEQALVRAYLEAGGKLFVSGSELAWDLGQRGNATDQAFLRDFLKVTYAGDESGSYEVSGVSSGIFDGANLRYGASPYVEDYPDYFQPAGGGAVTLQYGNGLTAGVAYSGPFGAGSTPGKVVVLGFPFETISGLTTQNAVMQRVLGFFFPDATDVEGSGPLAATLQLHPAYPNPFRGRTTISFTLPHSGPARLSAYDALGRQVARLADVLYPAGTHRIQWSPEELAPGLYFLRLEAAGATYTTTVTRVR